MGKNVGAVSEERYKSFIRIKERYTKCLNHLESISMSVEKWNKTFPHLNAALKPKGLYLLKFLIIDFRI